MDLSKFKYSKSSDKVRDEIEPEEREDSEIVENIVGNNISAKPFYQKSEGKLTTNLVFVLSGGEKREKDFFKELLKKRLRSLRVLFMSKKEQGLFPYQMEEVWKEIKRTGRLQIDALEYRLERLDKVFLLTDVDEFYDQIKEIGHGPEGLDNWIISNPCFETWLYYCYLNNPEEDLASLASFEVSKRSQQFKKLQNSLIPGGLNPIRAFEHLKEGINNSSEHYAEDENKIPLLFSTQMHYLAQYLLDVMETNNKEYSRLMQIKEDNRNMYRK